MFQRCFTFSFFLNVYYSWKGLKGSSLKLKSLDYCCLMSLDSLGKILDWNSCSRTSLIQHQNTYHISFLLFSPMCSRIALILISFYLPFSPRVINFLYFLLWHSCSIHLNNTQRTSSIAVVIEQFFLQMHIDSYLHSYHPQ